MKHALRIIVTILVLVALGFGAWAIWFKPDPDQSTFLNLGKMDDYFEQIGFSQNLQSLGQDNTHGSGYVIETREITEEYKKDQDENILEGTKTPISSTVKSSKNVKFEFEEENHKEIMAYRTKLFTEGELKIKPDGTILKITETEGEIIYSYTQYQSYLNSAYLQYYAYAQMAKDVTGSAQKEINKSIEDYKSAVERLNNAIESVHSYQKVYNLKSTDEFAIDIDEESLQETQNEETKVYTAVYNATYTPIFEDNQMINIELQKRYEGLISQYRSTLVEYCNLINDLKEFVRKFVFDGNSINDLYTVKNDLMVMAIEVAMSQPTANVEQTKHANEMLITATQFIKETEKESTTIDAYSLISSYNRVTNEYMQGLETVMNKTKQQKLDFCNNVNSDATIISEYKEDLRNILTLLGFGSNKGGSNE